MKKHFIAALTLTLSVALQAQVIDTLPDSHFENWIVEDCHPLNNIEEKVYHDPANTKFWATLNFVAGLPPELSNGPVTVYRYEGYDSPYSAKLVSKHMNVGGQNIFLPGVVGTLNVIFEQATATFGQPFEGRPYGLRGQFMYEPVEGDSAEIFIELYKTENKRRRVIGYGSFVTTETESIWKTFDIPIAYSSDAMPDSINVLCVSSAGYDFVNLFGCKGQVGSTLWVDNVQVYAAPVSTQKPITQSLQGYCYPNPSQGSFFLQLQEVPQNATLHVFDLSGREVLNQKITRETSVFHLPGQKPGLYTYSVKSQNQSLLQGKLMVL